MPFKVPKVTVQIKCIPVYSINVHIVNSSHRHDQTSLSTEGVQGKGHARSCSPPGKQPQRPHLTLCFTLDNQLLVSEAIGEQTTYLGNQLNLSVTSN